MRVVGAALAVVLLVGCTPDDVVESSEPLPTRAPADVCDFVSTESASIALGTKKFSVGGAKQDLRGSAKNPDGSKLNLAGCQFFRKDGELRISVELIGTPPYEERDVPTRLKAGGADFVFPAAEGQGVADAGGPGESAAVAQLIRGDWYYLVYLTKPTKGRNAVDDVVAILRQVVNQLGLPRSENLPRHTSAFSTPTDGSEQVAQGTAPTIGGVTVGVGGVLANPDRATLSVHQGGAAAEDLTLGVGEKATVQGHTILVTAIQHGDHAYVWVQVSPA
jgi:hypothetical protein